MSDRSEGAPEQGPITFEKQVNLAQAVFDAADEREDFVERNGGYEDFLKVHYQIDDIRDIYDRAEKKFVEAKQKFDETVQDKKAFAEHLRNEGDTVLADRITRMFVPRPK